MAVAIVKHKKISNVPDGSDTSVVQPSDWNDTHVVQFYDSFADIPPANPSPYDFEASSGSLPANSTSIIDVAVAGEFLQGSFAVSHTSTTTYANLFNGIRLAIPSEGTYYACLEANTPMVGACGYTFGYGSTSANKYVLVCGGGSGMTWTVCSSPMMANSVVRSGSYNIPNPAQKMYFKIVASSTRYDAYCSNNGKKFSRIGGLNWSESYVPSMDCILLGGTFTGSSQASVSVLWFRKEVDGVYHG